MMTVSVADFNHEGLNGAAEKTGFVPMSSSPCVPLGHQQHPGQVWAQVFARMCV